MDNKIVLGFPYAGALLWLISAEEHYGKGIYDKYDGSHPYYKTLFGKRHNAIINETVSLTLLFDKIYLAPSDTYYPGRDKFYNDQMYHNKDLGLLTNWDWNVREWDKDIDILLNDPLITSILSKVPKNSRRQVLWDVINQISISNTFETAIFAIPSYLKLCQRVNKIRNPTANDLKEISSTAPQQALNKVFELSSLKFSITKLDEFIFLKQSKGVKEYSSSFRNYVTSLPSGNLDETKMLEAMMNAINNDEISSKISGGLSLASTVTGVISLIPFVGTVGGIVGLATDGSSRTATAISNKNKWWLLAPEISKQLSKKRIEILYNQKKGSS
jgi:hypothetical protein